MQFYKQKKKEKSKCVWFGNLNMFYASHFFDFSLLPFTQQRIKCTPLCEMNF